MSSLSKAKAGESRSRDNLPASPGLPPATSSRAVAPAVRRDLLLVVLPLSPMPPSCTDSAFASSAERCRDLRLNRLVDFFFSMSASWSSGRSSASLSLSSTSLRFLVCSPPCQIRIDELRVPGRQRPESANPTRARESEVTHMIMHKKLSGIKHPVVHAGRLYLFNPHMVPHSMH